MVRGEGMAPFHDNKRSNVQRWRGDSLQSTERASISPRQDANNDKDGGSGRGGGRGRFGNKDGDAGGGGSGGGGDSSRGGSGRGRFGGNRDDFDNNGRGGGRFGGGRGGGGNGGNSKNDNNDSDNSRGRGGSDGGGGRGSGNGNGNGSNNNDRTGNGNGRNNDNSNGNNRNNGNGNGRNNGNNSNDGSRGGGGGGSRFGNGDGAGNDNNTDANLPPADPPAETPTDVPPPAASAVDPGSGSPSPIDQETPEASVEPSVLAPLPPSTPAPDAAVPSDSPDPGTVALVSDAPPEAPAETSPAPTPAIPQLASDAAAPPPDVTPPPPAPEPSFSAGPSSSQTLPPSLPQSTTVAAPESLPTSFVEPNKPGDTSIDRGSEDGLGSDAPSDAARAGLDPTVERILISVGSIGAFILICFVGYLIWRAVKNSRRKKTGSKSRRSRGGLFNRLLPRISSRKQRAWEKLDDPRPAKGSPPSYREKASTLGVPQPQDFYAPEKSRPRMPQEVSPQPEPQARAPKSVELFVAAQRPNIPETKTGVQGPRASSLNGFSAASTMVGTHQAQDSFSSTAPMHFDTMMTEPDGSDTARSRMGPGVFFNQSEMARQPSIAYDPARRQVNRTSVMSSLSSGFGDGDIVLPTQTVSPPPQAAVAIPSGETANYSRRFSWTSHTTGQAGQRDTTYTQSSEDMPPRFRSLNSWIDQQTGRIKRAQQREAEQGSKPPIPHHPGQPGVPGVHNPPREPSFNLMMDDEEPRRVESVIPTGPQ